MKRFHQVFQLKVSLSDNKCFFSLHDLINKEELVLPSGVSIDFDDRLRTDGSLYEEWRSKYERVYKEAHKRKYLENEFEEDGSMTPFSDQLKMLDDAEKGFINAFQEWIGHEKLAKIRRYISSAGENVDLLIACNKLELKRLPWESWKLTLGEDAKIRISRSVHTFHADRLHNHKKLKGNRLRTGKKVRILMLIAKEDNVDKKDKIEFHLDSDIIKNVFNDTVKLEILKLNDEDKSSFKRKISEKLLDNRGWDILIFSGHSDSKFTSNGDSDGGSLSFSHNIEFHISEFGDELLTAVKNGLRVAIFNSCCGLGIGDHVIQCGLSQALIMREPIMHSAAQFFLENLCCNLRAEQDLQDAFQKACASLARAKSEYYSSHLLPSLFRHPSSDLFRFDNPLSRVLYASSFSVSELVFSALALGLSLLPGFQELLLDTRYLIQAPLREPITAATQNLKANSQNNSVALVVIDQESITIENENRKVDNKDKFKEKPIDRFYLAELVAKARKLDIQTVGIDYFLSTNEDGDDRLREEIEKSVDEKETWFVFASNEYPRLGASDDIANPSWSLEGDVTVFGWDLALPSDAKSCFSQSDCPFGYLLAVTRTLILQQGKDDLTFPNLSNQTDFQQRLSEYISGINLTETVPFTGRKLLLGATSIIDFSVPYYEAYDFISAHEFLSLTEEDDSLKKQFQDKILIVASGDYEEAKDKFTPPTVLGNWCYDALRDDSLKNNPFLKPEISCKQDMHGGELHAYIASQLLKGHQIIRIPDVWIVLLSIFVGKYLSRYAQGQDSRARKKLIILWVGLTAVYGMGSSLLYVLPTSVMIPFFLPSVMFWIIFFETQKRRVKDA